MVFCHRMLAVVNLKSPILHNKGWVRVFYVPYLSHCIYYNYSGGEWVEWRRERRNPSGPHLSIGSGNLGGGDSFVGNIPGPSPSLYEACLKIISGS